MLNFSAIVGHQRLKRYGRNEKGLMRSLNPSTKMIVGEVLLRLLEPELQLSAICNLDNP